MNSSIRMNVMLCYHNSSLQQSEFTRAFEASYIHMDFTISSQARFRCIASRSGAKLEKTSLSTGGCKPPAYDIAKFM